MHLFLPTKIRLINRTGSTTVNYLQEVDSFLCKTLIIIINHHVFDPIFVFTYKENIEPNKMISLHRTQARMLLECTCSLCTIDFTARTLRSMPCGGRPFVRDTGLQYRTFSSLACSSMPQSRGRPTQCSCLCVEAGYFPLRLFVLIYNNSDQRIC